MDKTLLLLINFRIICSVLVTTWFVPDETWQSTEVAHQLVYGNGWLTWEWQHGLRSYIYPGFFACIYWILKLLGIDYPLLLIHSPRIISAAFFAYGEFCAVKLSLKWHGKNAASWTLKCLMTSWFLAYCSPRTLTNCVEMTFFMIALRFYPWNNEKNSLSANYLWWIGIGCIIRPTLFICALPYYLYHLELCRNKIKLILDSIFKVVFIFSISIIVDSIFTQKFTFVAWNFIKFNIIENRGSFYGIHSEHWYLTQGLPVILGFHMPFVIAGIWKNFRLYTKIILPCYLVIFFYSLNLHKEFRFILPLLPLFMCISGNFLASSMINATKMSRFLIHAYLILPNLLVFINLGCFHQSGSIEIVNHVRKMFETNMYPQKLLILTPCHSTPLYSYLHYNISIEFLTCEPNFENKVDYKDVADVFHENPQEWFSDFMSDTNTPDCIILFDSLELKIKYLLNKFLYIKEKTFYYSIFPEERRGKYIILYCRNSRSI